MFFPTFRHRRLVLGLLLGFAAGLAPRPAAAKIDPPVTVSLQVVTSPTLGGQCVVSWAGVPDLTPLASTLSFILESPGGAVTSSSQALALRAGQTAVVRQAFATPTAGAYRIHATLTMQVKGGRFARTASLSFEIPASGPARLTAPKALNAAEFAARSGQKTPVIVDSRPAKTSYSPAFALSGAYRFTNRLFNSTGFTGTSLDPIRRATVTILESVGGKTTTTLGATLTDDAGAFTFNVPAATAAGRDLSVVLTAESPVVRVQDVEGWAYPFSQRIVQWQGGALNLGTRDLTQAQSGPWNIVDAITQAARYVEGFAGAPPPRVVVRWYEGNTDGTYYLPYNDEIMLLGSGDDHDEFDDAVIMHEYGHFVARHYSTDKSPGGYHSWISRISPQLAWSEGWATFYSCVVRNNPLYLDTQTWSYLSVEIETPTDGVKGEDNEGAVAATLWDIFDTHDDGLDVLSDGFGGIWRVFHEFFTFRRSCTVRDLYDGWLALNLSHVPEVQNILEEHGIKYPPIVVTALAINNGAATAPSLTVTLNNTVVGQPVAYMASESSSFTGGSWRSYATAPYFILGAGTGNRGVYFKVKDALGNESAPMSDTILYGTVPVTDLTVNGPSAPGTIASEFDYDLYRFTVVTTGTYTIDTADVSISDAVMELYGPAGLAAPPLALNDDGHGSIDYMPAITRDLGPGTYTVKIAGFSGNAGSYTVWVKAGALPPPIPFIALDGPAVTGTIDTSIPTLENWFLLVIDKAGPCTIETGEITLYDTRMAIYGPYPETTLIEEDDDGGKAYMSLIGRNLEAGVYKIKVTSYDTRVSGSYSIRAYSGMRGGPRPLTINGAAIGDTITSATDFDWFTFQVPLPGDYFIQTLSGTLSDSYLYLYGPDTPEKFLAEANDGSNGTMASLSRYFTPGTYYCKVEGWRPTDVGSYRVQIKSDIQTVPLPTGVGWTHGEISSTQPAIWYQFTVAAAGGYTIDTAAGTLTDSVLSLFGPNNPLKLLAQNDDISAKNNMSRLTVWLLPGTYTVKVEGYGYAAAGTFLIRLLTVPAYPAQPLTINAPPTAAAISFSGELDWFSFTVANAGNYLIETMPGTLRSNYLRLFGPGNQVDFMTQDGAPGRMARTMLYLTPGTYYLRLQGYTAADLGYYTVQVRTEITWLTVEAPATAGTILDSRDMDWYAFSVTNPGSYTIDTTAGTLTDSYLRLYGPNGRDALMAADNDSGAGAMARITIELEAGTYFIKAQGYRAANIGTYSIAVRRTVRALALNTAPVSGKIDSSNDNDWYSFKLTGAGTVTIDTVASTLTDNVVRLYGPGSMTQYIAKDDNSGQGQMGSLKIALTPGTYYVRVNGRMDYNIGTYSIMVNYSLK